MEPACSPRVASWAASEAQIASTARNRLGECGFVSCKPRKLFATAKGRAGFPSRRVPRQDATPKTGMRMTGTRRTKGSIHRACDASNASSARGPAETGARRAFGIRPRRRDEKA